MKKNKAIVFGLLSVLSVSGVSAIVLANTFGLDTLVNAENTSVPCQLTWDYTTAPTNVGGKTISTAKNGVTQLVYTGVNATRGKNHVVLDIGGKIQPTGEAFNKAAGTNGVINSIKTVTVWFEDKAGNATYYEGEGWGAVEKTADAAKLAITAGSSGNKANVLSNTYLQSGVPIDLDADPNIKADCFYLEFSRGFNVPDDFEGTCEISKIVVTASMEVRYDVSFKDLAGKNVDVYAVSGNKLGRKLEDLKPFNYNFPKNSKLALRVNTKAKVLTAQDVTVEGATVEEVVLEGEKDPTVVVTIGESDANIIVNKYSEPKTALYPAEQYSVVGTYNFYNTVTNDYVDVKVNDDGTYNLGAETGTFTSTKEAGNKATFASTNEHHAVSLEVLTDGTAKLTYSAHSTDGTADTSFIGAKKGATPVVTIGRSYKNEWQGFIGTYNNGQVERKIAVFDKNIWIDGVDGTSIMCYGGTLATSELYKISITKPLKTPNEDFDFGDKMTVTFEETADAKIGSVYFKKMYNSNTLDTTKPDTSFLGTYTCSGQPDLILDGFNNYKLGDQFGTFDKAFSPNRAIINGEHYKLDNSNKTYEKIVFKVNFLADGEVRNYKSPKGTIDVTFNGTSITDNILKKSQKYSFNAIEGTIKADIKTSKVGRTYKFAISEDKNILKVISAYSYTVYFDYDAYDYLSNNDEESIPGTPCDLTLQKMTENPFTVEKSFSNGTHTFIFGKNKVIIPKTCKNISSYTVEYKLEGNVATFTYDYLDPNGDGFTEYATSTITLTFNQDFTSFSFTSDSFAYSEDDGYGGLTYSFIDTKEVFNIIK